MTGWNDVFHFTFIQNTRNGRYLGTTILIAILLLIAPIVVNAVLAMKDAEEKQCNIKQVYVKDDSGLEGVDFTAITSLDELYENITVENTEDPRLHGMILNYLMKTSYSLYTHAHLVVAVVSLSFGHDPVLDYQIGRAHV